MSGVIPQRQIDEALDHAYGILYDEESIPQYTAQDAIDQIDSKEYLTPWAGSGKKLYKIGVVFDYAKRNITEWEIV
jgi:hypothetical protein